MQFHNPDDEFDCDRRDPWMDWGWDLVRSLERLADKIDMIRYEILGNKEMNRQELNINKSIWFWIQDSQELTSTPRYSTTTCWQIQHLYGNYSCTSHQSMRMISQRFSCTSGFVPSKVLFHKWWLFFFCICGFVVEIPSLSSLTPKFAQRGSRAGS